MTLHHGPADPQAIHRDWLIDWKRRRIAELYLAGAPDVDETDRIAHAAAYTEAEVEQGLREMRTIPGWKDDLNAMDTYILRILRAEDPQKEAYLIDHEHEGWLTTDFGFLPIDPQAVRDPQFPTFTSMPEMDDLLNTIEGNATLRELTEREMADAPPSEPLPAPQPEYPIHEALTGTLQDIAQRYFIFGYTIASQRARDNTLSPRAHQLLGELEKYLTTQGLPDIEMALEDLNALVQNDAFQAQHGLFINELGHIDALRETLNWMTEWLRNWGHADSAR